MRHNMDIVLVHFFCLHFLLVFVDHLKIQHILLIFFSPTPPETP